ncbi:Tab2/Atab2 family RNA-binding protein [Coleofasciculus sp. FACHB-SPT9]|uniref:Tab2/Atab2 family RNA-binding protein n=1 Tax=Cyanophyceae TaxID=3028117 RepID=UPI001682F825|nr:Tab2/Atab2 family RNA-binding protein [Coleofasciculus sp. FACHB-SPT9]MBD1892666.1 Tab2/Atab2 family RNA-binding protein [Coleofasciculus sp. FACHB-SPT9]
MNRVWQADFYRRPLKDEKGQVLWELLLCDATRSFSYDAFCPQSEANASWLVSQLQQAAGGNLPNLIQVFRPQSLTLIQAAAQPLGIKVEATRRTRALKEYLQQKAQQYPKLDNYTYTGELSSLDKPPPVPLPENLWGEQWRFATLPAVAVVEAFAERPIPILEMPEFLLPINLGLASTVPVPGVVIYGGRQSMRLARWLQEARPVSLNYIAGAPDGLVLEAGLVDRWIVATFEDKEVTAAAQAYQQRQQQSRGLHFLLVQPDESGMTFSGFWLLRGED